MTVKVDKLFSQWDKWNSPGAALAVVREGKIIYKRGYGCAQLEYNIPITPSTIFHVASVSKQFTAFSIAVLADQGKLSLDDEIQKHLPEIPDFDKTITIRHLIHHISGLRDQWELLAMAGWRLDDVITKEHILKMVRHQKDLNFEPGVEQMVSQGVLNNGRKISYAFALSVGKHKGLKIIGHSGGDAGFRSYLMIFPEHDLGIAILSNAASFNTSRMARQVADIYLAGYIEEEPTEPTTDESKEAKTVRVKPFTPTPDELKAFTGEYYSEELGTTYTIVFQDSQLLAQHRRHDEFPLSPTIVDHFASQRWWFRIVDFQRDDHGKITGFKLTGGRVRNLRFRRLEK